MSEKPLKQQVMIARQQLDKLSIFISSLADFFYGSHPKIDDEFQQIKKLLKGKPDYEKAAQIAMGLNAKLKSESQFLQQTNTNTLSQIQQSLRELYESTHVQSDIKQDIQHFVTKLANQQNSEFTPIKQFERALSLFKKVLLEANLPRQAAINNSELNTQASNRDAEANASALPFSNTDSEKALLYKEITQELRALIAPYQTKCENDSVLNDLTNKLNQGLNSKDLLACCLIMIRFIVSDVLKEASSASRLINDIHQALVNVNEGIGSTISNSKSQIKKRQQQNETMQAQISAMELVISDSHNVNDLKEQTANYLSQLHKSLNRNEQEDRAEQQNIICLLETMQKRIAELESKANQYQQSLVKQRKDSMTDALTKLPNRLAYQEKVESFNAINHNDNKSAFLAVLDIDHFKQINDKYGHSVGDKTLQIIASHISKQLSPNDFVARWGGEEFVAILHDATQQQCFDKLELLRKKIAGLPFKFKGSRVSVTISIGLSDINAANNIEDAFEIADNLLFEAKKNGRNQTCTS